MLKRATSGGRPCRWRHCRSTTLVFVLALGAPVTFAAGASDDDESKQTGPPRFGIRKEDPAHAGHLDQFDDHCRAQRWELAFRELNQLFEANPGGMVKQGDGDGYGNETWVATRARMWRTIAALPPEGIRAYRLFNDAKANQLWSECQARDQSGDGANVIAELETLFDRYFITSVGDEAADRLGDARFEAGEFAAAERTWQAIVEQHPGTDRPIPQLLAKRATALARLGRHEALAAIAHRAKAEHAESTVRIGGRDARLAEYVASLSLPGDRARQASAETRVAISLPADDAAPAWQTVFGTDERFARFDAAIAEGRWWYGSQADVKSVVPASAIANGRLYCNWLGVVWATDVSTGEVVWRTREFSELDERFTELAENAADVRRYTLVPADDAILVTGLPLGSIATSEHVYRIVCLDAATGKVRWASQRGPLEGWSAAGQPVVRAGPDEILLPACEGISQSLSLLSISMTDGTLHWKLSLGTMVGEPNWRGAVQICPLSVLLNGDTAYVLTHNGALLAVDLVARRVEWAMLLEAPVAIPTGVANLASGEANGMILAEDGATLYVKETGGTCMYAIDITGVPSIRWRRTVNPADTLAGTDARNIYLSGLELAAIERKTRILAWATQIPVPAQGRAVISGDRVYAFLGRGIYAYDAGCGDQAHLVRGADRDSRGGSIHVTDERLICVSNRALTAYRMDGAAKSK